MWNYNEKVMDHFLNPRNVGEIENADAVAEVGNMACGDALKLYLKLDDEGRIADVKFQTFGCASAIASSSALTELVKGITLDEAAKVTNQDIVKIIDDLPEEKMHCSVMGMEALQMAIADYRKRNGLEGGDIELDDDHEGRIICRCFGITDTQIRKVAKINNLKTAQQITEYTKAGGACGFCIDKIQEILDDLNKVENPNAADTAVSAGPAFDSLSPVKKILRIQEIIDREIRPQLEHDGGSIELIDLDDNVVKVQLKGVCATCPNAQLTLRKFVQAKLNELLSPGLTVEEA